MSTWMLHYGISWVALCMCVLTRLKCQHEAENGPKCAAFMCVSTIESVSPVSTLAIDIDRMPSIQRVKSSNEKQNQPKWQQPLCSRCCHRWSKPDGVCLSLLNCVEKKEEFQKILSSITCSRFFFSLFCLSICVVAAAAVFGSSSFLPCWSSQIEGSSLFWVVDFQMRERERERESGIVEWVNALGKSMRSSFTKLLIIKFEQRKLVEYFM